MACPLLRIPEVVERLGVSRAKVYELMASGELRSVRIGGSRRVHVDDLDRFLAELDAPGPWPLRASSVAPETQEPAEWRPCLTWCAKFHAGDRIGKCPSMLWNRSSC